MNKFPLGLSVCSLVYGMYTSAEETNADPDTTTLETITVTATGAAEALTDVGASITVKSRAEIEMDAAVVQKELLNSIAGVLISQTGSTLGHKTSIRMPSNTSPYYLFLQDGIPVQSPGFFNHNGLAYTNYASAGGTDVLKGTGTALYGSDAVAATINVRSKTYLEDNQYTLSSELGSYGFGRFSLSGGYEVAPGLGLSFDGSHAQGDGWRQHTKYQRNELSVRSLYDMSDRDVINVIFVANSSESEMAGSIIGLDALYNNPASVGDIESKLDDGVEMLRQFDFSRLSGEWEHEYDDYTSVRTTAYVRQNRNRYVATWESHLPQNDATEQTLGLMLRADRDVDDWRYIGGLDIEYTQANRRYIQLFDHAKAVAGNIYDYDVDFYAISPYLRTEYRLSDRWQVAAGLRYDDSAFDYTNNTTDGAYGDSKYFRAADNNDPHFQHLSPKLDLSYQSAPGHLWYARYANGFRTPSASRLYALKTNNAEFTLDAEFSDTYEVGFKRAHDNYSMTAALYRLLIGDKIIARTDDDGDRYYANGGQSEHQGLEYELLWHWSDQLSTKLAYSYATHHYVNDEKYGHNEQASAPNHSGNLRLIYRPLQIPDLTALWEWAHVGEYWMDDENTTRYAGYGIANLKLSYQPNAQLRWFAKINNMANTVYADSAVISYGQEKYTPAEPRQVFMGLSYTF